MSEYVNGASININDMVRVDLQDQTSPTNINTIFSVVMNYETLKMITQMFEQVIQTQDEKLAELKKAN